MSADDLFVWDCCAIFQAAAALSIGCGSFSEPDEIEGLAHFVEHMVFMGNKKYPEENSFDVFVKVGRFGLAAEKW